MIDATLSFVAAIGADPKDDEETRIQKSLLTLSSMPFMAAGILWGCAYLALGAYRSAMVPLSSGVFLVIMLVVFGATKNYLLFRRGQLLVMLLLPFLLMMSLGGFINGSAVIIWSFLSPMGALILSKPKESTKWFIGFCVATLVSFVAQPHLEPDVVLSDTVVSFLFLMNLSVVGTLIYFMVRYFVSEKNTYQKRSEELLLNILPRKIVDVLKKQQQTVADDFESVSVLFADVVNFTQLSSTLSPTELVEVLNEVFQFFDGLVDKYELEKIKTIGDCYMVASGVPEPRADHASRLVAMALEAQSMMSARTFAGIKLEFRIGINSGPVVAGVIGTKKFSYDLWGDTVNTASRMESHGQKGMVQITAATYELIKSDYACESLGTVDVKGKGQMNVYHVLNKAV